MTATTARTAIRPSDSIYHSYSLLSEAYERINHGSNASITYCDTQWSDSLLALIDYNEYRLNHSSLLRFIEQCKQNQIRLYQTRSRSDTFPELWQTFVSSDWMRNDFDVFSINFITWYYKFIIVKTMMQGESEKWLGLVWLVFAQLHRSTTLIEANGSKLSHIISRCRPFHWSFIQQISIDYAFNTRNTNVIQRSIHLNYWQYRRPIDKFHSISIRCLLLNGRIRTLSGQTVVRWYRANLELLDCSSITTSSLFIALLFAIYLLWSSLLLPALFVFRDFSANIRLAASELRIPLHFTDSHFAEKLKIHSWYEWWRARA